MWPPLTGRPHLVLTLGNLPCARRTADADCLTRRPPRIGLSRPRVVEVDMLNLNLSAFQSQEFIVGIAVAAILVSALVASSLFRNVALALGAGAIVLLYLQGGVGALLATSSIVEKEIRSLPDFSNGLVVG